MAAHSKKRTRDETDKKRLKSILYLKQDSYMEQQVRMGCTVVLRKQGMVIKHKCFANGRTRKEYRHRVLQRKLIASRLPPACCC